MILLFEQLNPVQVKYCFFFNILFQTPRRSWSFFNSSMDYGLPL
jgi:hypothetical protein